MPKVAIYKMDGEKCGEIELIEEVFGIEPNIPVMHIVIKAQLNNKRQGTRSALTRSEVRGGGRRPYRQKGTGQARHSSRRSPIFRTGGVVFAPKPRSYRSDVNKKVRRLAMKSALSSKVLDEQMIIIDTISFEKPNTKGMIKMLGNIKAGKTVLIITTDRDDKTDLSARNIPGVTTAFIGNINVLDIMKHDSLILSKDAAEKIQEVYA